jgi:secernin
MVVLGPHTRAGATLFAKNSDRSPRECQPLAQAPHRVWPPGATVHCQYLEIPQAAETAAVIGSRPFWLWGFEHGLNEYGVAIGNEAVLTREMLPSTGLLGMDLVRLGLERAKTAREAVEVIGALVERHGKAAPASTTSTSATAAASSSPTMPRRTCWKRRAVNGSRGASSSARASRIG